MDENSYIKLVGVKENNLKNVTLSIPKKKITVFTGVSGSGKSSIVFDTISKEAQRQLNQTFTAYIQNRLPSFSQPDAMSIENMSLDLMKQADWIIDLGPDGGKKGGEIMFAGTPQELVTRSNSLTAQYLRKSCLT